MNQSINPVAIKADNQQTDVKQQRLKIAVQKSGRLTDNSFDLLTRCGIKFSHGKGQLECYGENLPVDVMLVRDDDIPDLVGDGICDLGFVGANVAREQMLGEAMDESALDVIRTLDFGQCRLAIAVPQGFQYSSLKSLRGKRIATTYPNLLADYLTTQNIQAEIVELRGAVEIAPRLGKADCICDLVSSGATLAANNLVEVQEIMRSHAVILRNNRDLDTQRQILIEKLLRRIDGVLQVAESKYIMLHAPRSRLAEITSLLPGAESPTVLSLEGNDDRVAIHAVCRESVFWETLETLRGAGASALLVLPVEKMLA